MASLGKIIKAVSEIGEHLKKPPVGELGARGTAAAPTALTSDLIRPMTTERAPNVPFVGAPELKPILRETEDRSVTAAERVEELKTQWGGLVRPFPNTPKDIAQKLVDGRGRAEAAHEIADLDVGLWYNKLTTAPAEQATLISDYMTATDELAQAKRYGKDKIRDIELPIWEQSVNEMQKKVEADPEVQGALESIRTGLDEQFDDMVARGWIEKSRYLEDYTPIRRINAVIDGLATFYGEEPGALKTKLIDAQMKRTGAQRPRETDVLNVFRGARAEYLRKVAEHETFIDMISDPTINLTDKFANGQPLPKGVRVFRPGAGGFGSTIKSKEGYFLDAALKNLDPKGNINVGGWVFPESIAKAMESFSRPAHTGAETKWYKMGTNFTKMLTVYNPANTNTNRISDLAVAMFLPAEGKAQPLGVLRWYGKGTEAGYKGAFNKGGTIVELHGKKVDVWDLAIREQMTSGTIAREVSNEHKLPPELVRLHPEAQTNHDNWWAEMLHTLEADRLATEVAPRIAAGLEAVERSGDWSQFGKVGREITFRYGAGAPAASQFPALRLIAPFIQFQGLATARVLDMANAKSLDPKARIALGLVAVPLVTMMWNNQNDAYKQVELALPEYERNQMHIIVPDPVDPAKVRRDVEGGPVVLRFRYWVPEQVSSMVGMSNLPSRVARVAEGRDTPMQFATSIPKEAAESISGMLVLPSMVKELATGKASSGQPMKGPDWINRLAPITRIGTKAYDRAQDYGIGEGVVAGVGEVLGVRTAKPAKKGARLLDAQYQDVKRRKGAALRALQNAARNKSGSDVKRARKEYDAAVKELKRVKAQMKAEKAEGYTPPKPDKAAIQRRREGAKAALEGEE